MRIGLLPVLLLVPVLFGCGDASQTTTSSTAANSATEQQPAADQVTMKGFTPRQPSKSYADPRVAVNDFLIAVTSGDNDTATSLLTVKSQQELWSNGLEVFDAGLPGSTFKVTEMEQRSETEAHVETVWVDENRNQYPCVWLLRKERQGWAIFGMATKFLPHVDPVILPFEDQQELARRKEEAGRIIQQYEQQQLAARQQAANANQVQPASANGAGIGNVQQASRNVEIK